MDKSFTAQVHRSAGGQLPHFAAPRIADADLKTAAEIAAVLRCRMLGR